MIRALAVTLSLLGILAAVVGIVAPDTLGVPAMVVLVLCCTAAVVLTFVDSRRK